MNGRVIFNLTNTGGSTGTLSGSGTFTTQQALDLKANGLYVNVHSSPSYTGGEIRDQLRFATPTVDGTLHRRQLPGARQLHAGPRLRRLGPEEPEVLPRRDAPLPLRRGHDRGQLQRPLHLARRLRPRHRQPVVRADPAHRRGGFDGARPTLELPNTDFGIRFGTTTARLGYVNVATYTGAACLEHLPRLASPRTAPPPTRARAALSRAPRSRTATRPTVTANTDGSGFEIKLPLVDHRRLRYDRRDGDATSAPRRECGWQRARFQLFTAYASSNGGFFSSDVIPEVPGNGATNLGANPNFVALPGVQATPSSTLPVELSSFTASADGQSAVLRWTTESETNNAGFSVESLRGGVWTEAAFVAGRGTTSERASYERRIEGLSAGRHTFRLVQRDLDGTTAIGGTVEVAIAPDGAFSITTRRLGGSVVLGIAAREAQAVTVEAFDVMGRRVARLFAGTIDGSADVAFDTAALPSGVYLVRVMGERASATRSVVVAR